MISILDKISPKVSMTYLVPLENFGRSTRISNRSLWVLTKLEQHEFEPPVCQCGLIELCQDSDFDVHFARNVKMNMCVVIM